MEHRPEFDDIRPYYDEEMPATVERLLADPQFESVINSVFPDIGWERFKTLLRSYKTPFDLQANFIKERVFSVAAGNSSGLSSDGIDRVSRTRASTFISNHRDIVLDALLLNAILLDNGFHTTEVAIGDNLLIYPWIEDIVRLNNNFIVKRGVSMHEMLQFSKHLSQYIHYAIEEKRQSIWIAQREGRAKDSNDRTQESLLKMMAMGTDDSFLDSLARLNITPVAISYEYDPCDWLKAREFQLKRDDPTYRKTPMDDQINMLTGLTGFKGKIHFQFGRPVGDAIAQLPADLSRNEAATRVAGLIDREIFLNYRFYPVNYIAYERLWGDGSLRNRFTADDERQADQYFTGRIEKINLPNKDVPFLTEKMMEMYAWPLRNHLEAQQ